MTTARDAKSKRTAVDDNIGNDTGYNKPRSSFGWKAPVGAALVAVVLLVVAILATRAKSPTKTTLRELGSIGVSGVALAPLPDPHASDPVVGLAGPSIVGSTFDRQIVSIKPGTRPTVLMFVAHWCPHCRREVPKIVKWLKASTPTEVDLFAVATATQSNLPNYPPSVWLTRESWPVKTIADDTNGSATKAYGVSAFPFFVVFDTKGAVVERVAGELTQQQFTALFTAATTGKPA